MVLRDVAVPQFTTRILNCLVELGRFQPVPARTDRLGADSQNLSARSHLDP